MRIVIAEDSTLLREGLSRLLADEGHEVVAGVGNAVELRHVVEREVPDLVLLDVRMPPTYSTEGIDAARCIKEEHPQVAVLVLSQYVEHRNATGLLTNGWGGVGYLLKDRVSDVGAFLTDLERVAAGGTAFDPEVVRQLFASTRRTDPVATLTEREREVLEALAQGLTNTGIADRLTMSVSAVEKHVNSIFVKLDLPREADRSRRVRAVLLYLESTGTPSSRDDR
ncbi:MULTISPECIES: response regulator transcription factor [Rhodococcus]|uniref:LuxR family two component transcriptional regulator n=1 Tax=Rhodococcus pyridinivorans AK37 TaxID=1114960 RepID=H0JYD6_9NOCA|nr:MULTISPECIES: response regulator transcription factor [Rhodococcus]EHK80538.1 LuxR family two component transcriptional regulator [Rhodococcus pyridinivorans AK37]MBX4171158.1 response regulator transcription factor [Rhodococcus sp. DMU2021]MCD2142914.1 response regulator transcription factor [Rhodococcus pyridinivorans]MCW3469378.1 response regulator transcription factor [Rhodococcus pyridinivorans]QXF82434.1 response regulator transcription factor [Rhodococcus pyridinivorans]